MLSLPPSTRRYRLRRRRKAPAAKDKLDRGSEAKREPVLPGAYKDCSRSAANRVCGGAPPVRRAGRELPPGRLVAYGRGAQGLPAILPSCRAAAAWWAVAPGGAAADLVASGQACSCYQGASLGRLVPRAVTPPTGYAIVTVRGDLDAQSAARLWQYLSYLMLQGRHHIVLDLAGMVLIDSAG